MLTNLALAFLLLALTVTLHAAGLSVAMRRLPVSKAMDDARFGPRTWLLVRIAAMVVAAHTVEIALWALFYCWTGCLTDFESSLYFSVVTYTTVGYGDIVLSQEWRLFAGAEALTGILMCGWSTGFFFSVVNRMNQAQPKREEN